MNYSLFWALACFISSCSYRPFERRSLHPLGIVKAGSTCYIFIAGCMLASEGLYDPDTMMEIFLHFKMY